jgi:hypothetical protein
MLAKKLSREREIYLEIDKEKEEVKETNAR